MKAAVIYGKQDIRIEDVETPQVGPDDVRVRVKACGICHYDLRFYTGNKQLREPHVLGHECAGVVEEVGDNVSEIKVGDRVAVYTDISCGHCSYCIQGRTNLCLKRVYTDGGFAEYKVAPVGQVFKFSDQTNFDEASLTEPLACCLNAAMRGRVGLGSRVVVVGAGPMGLLHIELARALGASKVVVTELMSNRREKALEVGADNAVDPTTVDPVQEVVALTGGLGADLVIIAVENTAALEQGIRMVGKQGTAIVFAGFHPSRDIKLDANLVHYGEICITGSSDFPMYLFPKALEMIDSRRVHVKSLISHTFSIERIGEGFRTALGLKGFKVVIRP